MPWITKNFSHSSKVRSSFFTSFLITALHKTNSPSFLCNEKDKTFVDLFFPRYFLFSSLDLLRDTYATEREYFLPRISFFMLSILFSKRIYYLVTILPSLRRCSISFLRLIFLSALLFNLSFDSFLELYREPFTF